ncbi:MAG: hypothetical protein ACRC5T_13495 [Cetobacterium sp.]
MTKKSDLAVVFKLNDYAEVNNIKIDIKLIIFNSISCEEIMDYLEEKNIMTSGMTYRANGDAANSLNYLFKYLQKTRINGLSHTKSAMIVYDKDDFNNTLMIYMQKYIELNEPIKEDDIFKILITTSKELIHQDSQIEAISAENKIILSDFEKLLDTNLKEDPVTRGQLFNYSKDRSFLKAILS